MVIELHIDKIVQACNKCKKQSEIGLELLFLHGERITLPICECETQETLFFQADASANSKIRPMVNRLWLMLYERKQFVPGSTEMKKPDVITMLSHVPLPEQPVILGVPR